MTTEANRVAQASPALGRAHIGSLALVLCLYAALTLPYAFTKLNGDELNFVTLPYLIIGGDYTLSAVKSGEYGKAFEIAATSYGIAWRYVTRPKDADENSAAALGRYEIKQRASSRQKPFVFAPDYFVTHRKAGKPLLSFLLNVPSLAVTRVFAPDLLDLQRKHIYHPGFLLPRLVYWLMGAGIIVMIYFMVRRRDGHDGALRAALMFTLMPVVAIYSADIHQDVPLTFFLVPFFYFAAQKRYVWAGVFWGLAFACKNQAVFALLPFAAEFVWQALGGGSLAERLRAAREPLVALTVVFVIGLLVSAPFAHPLANLHEIVNSSAGGVVRTQQAPQLFARMPIWLGISALAFLGLKMLDLARDSFERLHIFMLIVPAILFLVNGYRLYMLMPSVAILLGTHLLPRTFYFLAAGLLLLNLHGLESPYLTSRRLLYDRLLEPGAPQTIDDIERLKYVNPLVPPEMEIRHHESGTPPSRHR